MMELHGPFRPTYHLVSIDGYEVPNVRVYARANGTFALSLDERFCSEDVTEAELHRWVWLLANAQAIGAGYACHGAEAKYNPFRKGIGALPPMKLELVPGSPSGGDAR